MRRLRWRGLTREELLADPDAPRALLEALERGGRQACSAYAWATGLIRDDRGAAAALRVVEQHKREQKAVMPPNVTVAAIPVAEGVEVRASLSRWGGREAAHLRTWFRGRDGRWRPTRRGVTVAPEQLETLEAAVRAMREAYAAGVLAPAPISAPCGTPTGPPDATEPPPRPDTMPTA